MFVSARWGMRVAEGRETEGPEEAEPAFDTGAAGIAVALDEARADPTLRDEVAGFLAAHRSLIDLQKHHLKAQFAQLRLRSVGDAVKLALQVLSLAAVLGVAGVLGLMVHDATTARGMVVAGFSAPPSLAARGLTGDVLAGDLTHRISGVARVTNANSLTQSEDASAESNDSVKLDIPETRVSLNEVARFLRRRLGHETRINGALTDLGDGSVAIKVDVAGADPIEVRGKLPDLDQLMQQAAEKAFSAFDPDNFIIYLSVRGRDDEAFAASAALAATARSNYRLADAYSLWAEADGDRRRALSRIAVAARLRPQMMFVWMEGAKANMDLGHDEEALGFIRRLLQTRIQDQPPQDRAGFEHVRSLGHNRLDYLSADYAHLERDSTAMQLDVADTLALGATAKGALHDGAGSAHDLALARASASAPPRGMLKAQWYAATAAGDWPTALAAAEALMADDQSRRATVNQVQVLGYVAAQEMANDRPWLALAQAMNGRLADAQATLAPTPLDCYLCVRARARIAEAGGDRAAADRWFAEAVHQGPSLVFAHLEWADVKLARGDAAGAASEAEKAYALAPYFADTSEVWGEALLAQGDVAGATAKFRTAAALTPGWGRLRLKWGEALARIGKASDARAQFSAAAPLYLSATDRAELLAQHI